MKPKLFVIGATALLGLALVVPASARPGIFGRHGFGLGPGARPPQPDRACLQQCRQDSRTCLSTASAAARQCTDSTCSTQEPAARDACQADRHSDACQTARAAAGTCTQPCFATFETAIEACRTDTHNCADVCPATQPKDPQCLALCQSTLQRCQQMARDQGSTCTGDCGPLITAASTACATDPRSTDCRAAIQVASACLQPCADTELMAVSACSTTANTCVEACPAASTATPTAAPTATPPPAES
jgi:hypothetical protein